MMGGWGYEPFQNDTALDWQSTLFRKSHTSLRLPQEVRKMIDGALEQATIDKRCGAEEARAAAAFIYLFDLPRKKKAVSALKKVMFNFRWIAGWRSINKIITALSRQIISLGGKITKVEIKKAKANANKANEHVWSEYLEKLQKEGKDALPRHRSNIFGMSKFRRRARKKK